MSETRPPTKHAETAAEVPLQSIRDHIEEERRRISFLGEIREVVFGAQDGLVSTLAVVATVAGASSDNTTVLVAGIAAAMAGVFSMAIGEYMSSKSQAEIFEWQIADERREVETRPLEAEAEVAFTFMEEGMPKQKAYAVARALAEHPESLLRTMVSKELGLTHDEDDETAGSPLRGALFMGASFAAGGAFPILPFFFGEGLAALAVATFLTALVLFVIGAIKSRWTYRFWLWSGLEIVLLAAIAGVAGYLFGTLLPDLLGYSVPVG